MLPYNAVHSIQHTEQIPNDPPQMGAKSTTTSNHPSTPPQEVLLAQFSLYVHKGGLKPDSFYFISSVYFMSKKELNYNKFIDPNILGARRLVHSDLRIYRISFFLLDLKCKHNTKRANNRPTNQDENLEMTKDKRHSPL